MQPRVRSLPRLLAATVAVLLTAALLAQGAALEPIRRGPGGRVIQGLGLTKQVRIQPAFLAQLKRTKQRANMVAMQRMYFVRQNIPHIRVTMRATKRTREFALMPLADMDRAASATEIAASKVIPAKLIALKRYFFYPAPTGNPLPNVVDRRSRQTPIRDQGNRGTCVSHGSLACMEAFPNIPDDLSEQYAHHLFMRKEGKTCKQNKGLRTTNSARYLADGVCEEKYWRYQSNINDVPATHSPPSAATRNAKYKITRYQLIEDHGLTGASIKNTRYLEAVLSQGYNIVYGCYVAWHDPDHNGILDVRLDSKGNPVSVSGGHCMLMVGYNRSQKYFIVKNSWAGTWGHSGYGFLSYDYIKTYSKYGYYVLGTAPSAAPSGLPSMYTSAPYSSSKIPITKLRDATLVAKTSSGNYCKFDTLANPALPVSHLLIPQLKTITRTGRRVCLKTNVTVRASSHGDLDTGRQVSRGPTSDFWWHAVRRGVYFLEPDNRAQFAIVLDFAGITFNQVKSARVAAARIPRDHLRDTTIFVHTDRGNFAKITVHGGPRDLLVKRLVTYDRNGRIIVNKRNVAVSTSGTIDLDTGRTPGRSAADLWWHAVGAGANFLETSGRAKLFVYKRLQS